ncbi:MAG: [LysW]-lysine hydrolase [Chloroflexi bacterium]|nr:[LysW]-lysine hydrolase [Chloroflexota bacterium]
MALGDQAAVDLLRRLVEIPSISGFEEPAVTALVQAMSQLGFDASIDGAGNAVGTIGSGTRTVLLLGHIDTVPGRVPVSIEDGWLTGRGAVDAKGPLMAMVCAAARVHPLRNLRVIIVGAVEEESASSRGARFVAEHLAQPDLVVIGEPSRWNRITLGYKGRLLVDYELRRNMSHTAGPRRSVCESAVAYWEQLQAYAEHFNADRSGLFDRLDPSLRSIQSSSDGLSESVEMRIGLRLPHGLEVESLRALLEDAWASDAKVRLSGIEKPFRAESRNVLTGAFLAAIRAEGGRGAFVNKTGTSDMNVLGPHWSVPIVAYGPGDSSYDHTPEERIELDEYLRGIRVLSGVLQRLDAAADRAGTH